jgi:hypothetical protein
VPAHWESDSKPGKSPISYGLELAQGPFACQPVGAQHWILFSQCFCIPKSKAKGSQKFISLYIIGNWQVGHSILGSAYYVSLRKCICEASRIYLKIKLTYPAETSFPLTASYQITDLTTFLTQWIIHFTKGRELASKAGIIEAQVTFVFVFITSWNSFELG